ncbi:MAG: sulfotransferase domain-containing protein [Bacteroidetes bacterium]|nr:sulfotransferase domain-containing protein [Bacteroidota bacterium]
MQIDFIGVGSPKCGTEWLVACLREHPEIDFSKHKEPNIFLSPQGGLNKLFYKEMKINKWEEYMGEFDWTSTKKHGEFSIKYIFDIKALKKIKEHFPQIKVIAAIRNPIDFLYSNYWYMKSSNFHHLIPNSFEEAIEKAVEGDPYFKEYAYFSKHLENCYKIRGKENVHIILLDEIKTNPTKALIDLYAFIGVDKNFEPSFADKKVNQTKMLKYTFLMPIVHTGLKLISNMGLQSLINKMMNSDTLIRKIFRKFFFSNKKYPKISEKTKKALQIEFKPEIMKLQRLIERDLSSWL